MEHKKIEINFNFLIFLYLYIPILIFLIGWIKWHLTVGIVIMLVILADSIRRGNSNYIIGKVTGKSVLILMCCITFLLTWCILSGQGAFISQSGDWGKHNILLEDLVSYSWPVRYEFNGGGVIDYYIAGYLLPALLGKMLGGARTAELILLLWVCIGLLLTCMGLYAFLECKKNWKLILICGVFAIFSTFIVPLSGIYRILCPQDLGDGIHWLSSSIRIQYSSNIILLRWVFPQFVPTAVAMTGLLLNRKQIENWGIMCAPIVLYSSFCFIGMIILLLEFVIFDNCLVKDRKVYFQKMFGWKNICSIVLAAILCIYILGNVLQPKPESVAMGIHFINYSGHGTLWLVFQLSWLLWYLILWKNEYDNHLLHCAGTILFLLPFFNMGIWNDLVMRCSIPSLFMLCVLVIKNIVKKGVGKYYRNLLIGCLVINMIGGIHELNIAIKESRGQEDHRFKYADEEEFLKSEFGWQYVNWDEENSIVRLILK